MGKATSQNMEMVGSECLRKMWRSKPRYEVWRRSEVKTKQGFLTLTWKTWRSRYLPGYWLLSRSWPPLRVNPNPGKLSLGVRAALSSWLSTSPRVKMSPFPLKINTRPPLSWPPNGQPTATSEGWHTDAWFRHQHGWGPLRDRSRGKHSG